VDGVETAPIRSLSSRATGLMSMDFEPLRFQAPKRTKLEQAETRGEAALPSPQPSKAWMGGASGGLVCVERTLLPAASDSCPEKREQARSNRTGRRRRPRPPFAKYAKDGAPTAWLCLRDQKPKPAPFVSRFSRRGTPPPLMAAPPLRSLQGWEFVTKGAGASSQLLALPST